MSKHDDAAIEAALKTLEKHGITRDRAIVAYTEPYEKDKEKRGGGTAYDLYIGVTTDRDTAVLISLIADEIKEQARDQTQALIDMDETCPKCGTVRYVLKSFPAGVGRIKQKMVCLDCGHQETYKR